MQTTRRSPFLLLGCAVALAGAAAAQIPLSGTVHDGAGGPLLSGNVYHAAWFQVPAGQTLTVQPGAIVKGDWGTAIQVYGNLHCLGTASQPVVFTSIHDDSAGGDTNHNGSATVAAAGQWQGIILDGSANSTLQHAVIRCCGFNNQPCVVMRDCNPSLSDCTITDGLAGGLCLARGSLQPDVDRCHFERIAGQACVFGSNFGFNGCEFGSVVNFSGNTAVNCPGGPYIRVDVAGFTGNAFVDPANLINGALVYNTWPIIPAGSTLTLGPGTVLKALNNVPFVVDGTLRCQGTASAPVVFTSIADDAAGGDTNGDGGATAPAAGQWWGVEFHDGADASVLDHTTIRYCGGAAANTACVRLSNADVTLRDCTFADALDGGIDFLAGSRPIVQRCRFERIQGDPAVSGSNLGFSGCDFAAAAGFVDNVAVNCRGNCLRIDVQDQVGNTLLGPRNGVNGAIVLGRWVRIPAGASLQLQPGTVLKGIDYNASIQVEGTLAARETWFTSIHDDSHGGDTNGNGAATQPGRNGWGGVRFLATASGGLDHCTVAFGGYAGPAVGCASAQVALRAVSARTVGNQGFDLQDAAVAEDLVAFDCGADGFRLQGGSFALRRATSASNAGFGFFANFQSSNEVRSSIAWGNTAGGFSGFASGRVHYSVGAGISGGTGNANVDPQFVAGSAGDLRLQASSPCLEAGDPADQPLGSDANFTPRLLDGDFDGTARVDIGAFEFSNVELSITGVPAAGNTLTVTLRSQPAVQLAVVVFGFPLAQPLPLLGTGTLGVDLATPLAVLTVPAQWTAPLQVPNGLPSMTVAVQAVGFTAAFPVGNLSNTVRLRL